VSLAVDPAATYAEVEYRGERLILAKPRLQAVLEEDARVVREFTGEELVGQEYEPLYPLVAGEDNAYRVVGADFVSMEEGTGVVHIAPAFGEEDYELGKKERLPFVQPVDLFGKFTGIFPLARGRFVKEADTVILEDLRRKGRLFRAGTVEHEYPFCWRCDTPLLYYALESWFIATTVRKDEIIAENETVEWHPEHVGQGRFGDFLNSMRDWALSRDRFWGTPLPVWECKSCGELLVIGSREELVARAIDPDLARTVELHRPYVDGVALKCNCGDEMKRVPHVLDTWFDSGSMHTAQWHYPFENEDLFRENYPADFICEGLDQTRGWFYTLLVTGVLLHGKTPYKRVLVTGLGLDERGQKMSKSRGNVIDPLPVADQYGADAIRWYLASESAPWTVRRISLEGVRKARAGFLETVKNSHDFFALYAGIDGFSPDMPVPKDRPSLDRWLASRTAAVVAEVTRYLDAYKVVEACRALERYVDELSNWYIRLSRPRFWGGKWTDDKRSAYHALYAALKTLSKLIAPFTPFLAEAMWQSLKADGDPESVHLSPWPELGERDEALERWMERARAVANLGLAARNLAKVKVRQPLRTLYVLKAPGDEEIPPELWELVKAELNVKEVVLKDSLEDLRRPVLSPNFASLGPRLGAFAPRVATALQEADHAALWAKLQEGKATLVVDGREVELTPADVKVSWETTSEYVLLEEAGAVVALDTVLDEELRAEGDLRELIHRIQLARKEAGFEVTDRIDIGYEGEITEIFRRFPDRIREEVLAASLREGGFPDAEYTVEFAADVGDRRRDERERLATKIHGKAGKIYLRRINRDG
jgi:isoleucyl-tRNA synthetase